MIEIRKLSFSYANADGPALDSVSLKVKRGECLVLCGESGCGKTSLTRLINGLIPHYYEGALSGQVLVGGIEADKAELFETAHVVGSVFQNPRSQFFCVDSTSEIAFGCENRGLAPELIDERVAQSATSLGIESLLDRNIFELSGGEKQLVACASVSALHPDILVLDEPTSNLSAEAIGRLKEVLLLWKSQGKTIVIAEHRLHWLMDLCDRVLYLRDGRIALDLSGEELAALHPNERERMGLRALSLSDVDVRAPNYESERTLHLRDYRFSYGRDVALDIPSLSLPLAAVIAVIGRNGAGKSTFTHCLCGLERRFRGSTELPEVTEAAAGGGREGAGAAERSGAGAAAGEAGPQEPSKPPGRGRGRRQMLKACYLVMQDVNHQLFCESVADEVRLGMDAQREDAIEDIMSRLGLQELLDRHPLSLSGGQKQRVAVAAALLADKRILVFDEPTSGLDFRNMEQMSALISSLRGERTVFVVTHDPELIVRCCTHVLRFEGGKAQECYALAGREDQLLASFASFEQGA
ncbi:MAG: ABC transporter ATP-binding protein [Coriobacteriales bacterium]|jgi:energy-coupling factor transport system ATP-binding protein|nr:ABC transporter ATP-binding protein [Coriobacteriales bacterium]